MNTRIRDILFNVTDFSIDTIEMSYANTVSDIGVFRFKKIILVIKYYFSLIKKLFNSNYNFVYFQISPLGSTFIRDLIFVLIIKLSKTKIVYHLHGKGIKKKMKNNIYKRLYKYAFHNEAIILLSNLLKFDIEEINKNEVFIIPNGIPPIKYKQKIFSQNEKPLNILFLSNLFFSKGIMNFIEVIEILVKKKIKIKGFIVGAEADLTKDSLEEIIKSKNLGRNLIYLGPKYGNEKNKILSKTDLLIYPTLEDIWGNVNLEAMQIGIPVIATEEGAIPEIIDDGITGFIVEKNNLQQIVEKVEVFYNNRILLEKMGKAARIKYEEQYTMEVFRKNIIKTFGTILKN